MLSQSTVPWSKNHDESEGAFGMKNGCKCLFFTCTMESRPCPNTPETDIWRCKKQWKVLRSFAACCVD